MEKLVVAAQESDITEASSTTPRRRWLRRLVVLLLILAALPSLVTVSGTQRTLLGLVSPRLADAVSFDSAMLHWWAPIEISGLQVADLSVEESDRTLLTAERLVSRQTLLSVLWLQGEDCHFAIEKPVVDVIASETTTNVQATLNQLFESSDDTDDSFPISVAITNGRVQLHTGSLENPQQAGSLDNLNLSMETSVNGLEQLSLSTGVLSQVDAVADSDSPSGPQLTHGVNPRIAQVLDRLSSDQPLLPDTGPSHTSSVDNPAGSLRVDLQAVDRGRVFVAEATQLDLQDMGVLLNGLVPGLQISGMIDGRVEAVQAADHGGFAGRIHLLGTDLGLRHASWSESERLIPGATEIHGTLLMTSDALLLEDLRLTSDVMTAAGNGKVRLQPRDPVETLRAASQTDMSVEQKAAVEDAASAMSGVVQIHAEVDLAGLSRMMPQTLGLAEGIVVESGTVAVDLRLDTQLPGQSDAATLRFDRQPHSFRWQLATRISPLTAVVPQDGGQLRRVQVPSVVEGAADGICDQDSVDLRSAVVSGEFGQLTLKPEDDWWIVAGRVDPSLIWNQLQPLLQLDAPEFTGPVTVSTRFRTVDGVHQLMETSIDSSTLNLSSPRLTVDPGRNPLRMVQGQARLQGRAAALETLIQPWHDLSWVAPDSEVIVQLTGTDRKSFGLHALIRPSPGRAAAIDPEAGVLRAARADLELTPIANGRFRVEEGKLQIPGVTVVAEGTLDASGRYVFTEMTADVQYDLSQLSRQFLSSVGLRLNGRHQHRFQISGSPELLIAPAGPRIEDVAPSLAVSGTVRWDNGWFDGMSIGPGEAELRLQDGVVSSNPIQTSLAGGSVSALPRFDLNRNIFALASGSRVEKVSLTKELCEHWLGYVSPFLAESSAVEGQLSARLKGLEYHLDRPEESRFQGAITIHSGSALPGGSLQKVMQAIQLATQKQVAGRGVTLPPQRVDVQMSGGAIHHNVFEMDLAGWRLATSGLVGLNQQVQLTVDVPLERSTVTSRGSSLQIPVRGSVRQPQVDLQTLLSNAGQRQIQDRIDREIDRGLNRLLDQLR